MEIESFTSPVDHQCTSPLTPLLPGAVECVETKAPKGAENRVWLVDARFLNDRLSNETASTIDPKDPSHRLAASERLHPIHHHHQVEPSHDDPLPTTSDGLYLMDVTVNFTDESRAIEMGPNPLFLEIRSRHFVAVSNKVALTSSFSFHKTAEATPPVPKVKSIRWVGPWRIPIKSKNVAKETDGTVRVDFKIYRSLFPVKPVGGTSVSISASTTTLNPYECRAEFSFGCLVASFKPVSHKLRPSLLFPLRPPNPHQSKKESAEKATPRPVLLPALSMKKWFSCPKISVASKSTV